MTQILALLLAAFVLIGVPLMMLGSEHADERARTQAWSRNPSSGSTIAGHAEAQRVSGRTGVEPPPSLVAAPPVPPTPVGVDAIPLSTSTGLDSPPSPNALAGAEQVTPRPFRARQAHALVGDVVSQSRTSPTSFQGDHRG